MQIFLHSMSSNFECKKLQGSLFDEGAVVDWRFIGKTIKIIASTCINTLRTGDADLRFYVTTVQDG